MRFKRHRIYSGEPAERTSCVVGDVDGDGVPEVAVASRAPVAEWVLLDRQADGSWQSSVMDAGFTSAGVGGVFADLTGNGRLDLIAGDNAKGKHMSWWACPQDAGNAWNRHVVCQMPAGQTHDQLLADLDGQLALYFWNQGSQSIFRLPVPEDPTVSPWQEMRVIATGVLEEGLAVGDVDGDGRDELVAGQAWYRPRARGMGTPRVFGRFSRTPGCGGGF